MDLNESPHPPSEGSPSPFQGFAVWMPLALQGHDLMPEAQRLLARLTLEPGDAVALMDLSIILQLWLKFELALKIQADALAARQLYSLPAEGPPRVRLLALLSPGEMAANTPLEFLVRGSDVSLDLLYVSPHLPFPASVPEHDVVFVAANESDENQELLRQLSDRLRDWPRPVINPPHLILETSREGTYDHLRAIPGLVVPTTVRVERSVLEAIAREEIAVETLYDGAALPIIVRPNDSHAGRGLAKLDGLSTLRDYLTTRQEAAFYVMPFVDYRGTDGQFRKFRIVLIEGKPYAVHMAISDDWMIHFMNAGMSESAGKRAEEAEWMRRFDEDFAGRHAEALRALDRRMNLDFLVIDCAETPDGDLLVFEIDTGALIHAMDPVDLYPYKQPQMRKVFAAFRELLIHAADRHAGDPASAPTDE